ncbi:MAG TPA: acyl-CoA thioesterase [Firmicutes bacterium]|nr:acyl-CoA thioesterase [Bacillota bacterium]
MESKCLYRVIYGDTDQMGVMYHANYFRLFEIGRNEYFRKRGVLYREMEAKGIFLPVNEACCHYKEGARYDDLLEIHCHVKKRTRSSLLFEYHLKRNDALLAEGYTRHAFVNREGRVIRLAPEDYALFFKEEK